MKRTRFVVVAAAAVSGLLAIALSALPAVAAVSAAPKTTAPSRPMVTQPQPTVTKATAVRNSAGIYVAKTAGGSTMAALEPFSYTESRTVAANGDVTGSAEVAFSGNLTKPQLLNQAKAIAANQTEVFAELALASGQDAAGAASVWGAEVGARVAQLKVAAGSTAKSLVKPANTAIQVVPGVAGGCSGRLPFAPVSGYTSNNEITINLGGFSCMDYASGGDWYVAESMTETYETHSHGWYTYYPQKETANQYHVPTGGNRYVDWSPYTATSSITGCGTKTIGLTSTETGLSYSSTEDYCDGRISPWTSNGGTRIYSGSRFDCTTGWPLPVCETNANVFYGQHSESYLHSPPSGSYSVSHTLGWGWVNEYDVL